VEIPWDLMIFCESLMAGRPEAMERARPSCQAWRNYYPSLAYARGDPGTFLIPIDRAAHMAGPLPAQFL
jgi:hypothetical protein